MQEYLFKNQHYFLFITITLDSSRIEGEAGGMAGRDGDDFSCIQTETYNGIYSREFLDKQGYYG